MATAGIDISLDQLTTTAGNIGTLNDKLTDKLHIIQTEMKNLKDSWQSEAETELARDFDSYVPKFEEYQKVVKSYVDFLNQTVRMYTETETQLKNNADLFK